MSTWPVMSAAKIVRGDPAAYDVKARELATMFRENFERFDDPKLAEAGPRL